VRTVRLWSFAKLQRKRLKRFPLHLMLRNLAAWEPQISQEPGYTVIMACMQELSSVAIANLRLCTLLNQPRLHELLLVFDCPLDQIPQNVRRAVRESSSSMVIRLIGYDNRQYRVAKRINWGWVYSWLSWSVAIREVQTRVAIIHDLDAMPLASNIFEQIYDNWLQHGAEFCGISYYKGNGVVEEMSLVRTFEMAFDAGFVRRTFQPFDLFNKLRWFDGRGLDFDTMLDIQRRSPRRVVQPIDQTQLVHPSQLICQYNYLVSERVGFKGQTHMLPILAYFMYLGGDTGSLVVATPALAEIGATAIPLFGRRVPIDGIAPEGWAWMEKQIRRLEQHCFGKTRPDVEAFLHGMILRAGSHRTVGKEVEAFAVYEC
jgi:hypothetical protein